MELTDRLRKLVPPEPIDLEKLAAIIEKQREYYTHWDFGEPDEIFWKDNQPCVRFTSGYWWHYEFSTGRWWGGDE